MNWLARIFPRQSPPTFFETTTQEPAMQDNELADKVRGLSALFSDGRFAPSIAVEAIEVLHLAAEVICQKRPLAGPVQSNEVIE